MFLVVFTCPVPAGNGYDHQSVKASPGHCVSSSAVWSLPPCGPSASQPESSELSPELESSPSLLCISAPVLASALRRSSHFPPAHSGTSAVQKQQEELNHSLHELWTHYGRKEKKEIECPPASIKDSPLEPPLPLSDSATSSLSPQSSAERPSAWPQAASAGVDQSKGFNQ